MKKLSLLFTVFIAHCSLSIVIAQNTKIDSLENLLQQAGHDTTQVILLNKISQQYSNLSEYEKSLTYAGQALQLAEKNNYIAGIAKACGGSAADYIYQSKYDKALEYSRVES